MGKTVFYYDTDTQHEGKITNALNTMCIWNLLQYDNERVGGESDGFIKQMYPWLDYLILMTFTGGKGYNNWYSEDENGNPVYDFSKPAEVISNVLRGGVKPFIVIGQVPNMLSTHPEDFGQPGTDWGNRYLPKDWNKYYGYIKAFAAMLTEKFGKDEIKSWKFRLMTEWDDCFDSNFWWQETADDYFKLYDYTVAALESEIGEENLYFGMGNVKELNGDITDLKHLKLFLEHCANGTNYFTGKKGSKCRHISVSSYYTEVDVERLSVALNNMQKAVMQYPSLNINEIGIGEGGYIFDIDKQRMHCAQGITEDFATAVARIFDISNTVGSEYNPYFANWEYVTDRCNYDINMAHKPCLNTPAANVAGLINKMVSMSNSKKLLPETESYDDNGNIVSSLAAYDEDIKSLKILVYNHNPKMGDQGSETAEIHIKNLPFCCGKYELKCFRVDEKYGNFSGEWLKDSEHLNRKTIVFDIGTQGNSKYDTPIMLYLDEEGRELYFGKKNLYKELAGNMETSENITVKSVCGELCITAVMPQHSVCLLELSYK